MMYMAVLNQTECSMVFFRKTFEAQRTDLLFNELQISSHFVFNYKMKGHRQQHLKKLIGTAIDLIFLTQN